MKTVKIQPRFRVMTGKDVAIGPGKADLLEQLQATGSITKAAKKMGMSYMRAWTLVKTMEKCFAKPLVTAARGGAAHGGAQLTETGRAVLELYREIERDSMAATKGAQARLVKLLK